MSFPWILQRERPLPGTHSGTAHDSVGQKHMGTFGSMRKEEGIRQGKL